METESRKLAAHIIDLVTGGDPVIKIWLPDPERRYVNAVDHIAGLIDEHHRVQGLLDT